MDTVHECDRQTDRRTDGRTDRITITDTVQRIASHGKNDISTKTLETVYQQPVTSCVWKRLNMQKKKQRLCSSCCKTCRNGVPARNRAWAPNSSYFPRSHQTGVITVQKVGGRSEARRAESGGGILGVSSPSGVRGRAPKKFGFWCILGLNFAVFHVLRGQNLGDE